MTKNRDDLGHQALEWYDDQLQKDECTVTRDNFHMFVLSLIDDLLGMKGRGWTSVKEMMPPPDYGVLIRAGDSITAARLYKGSDGFTCWLGQCLSGADCEFEFEFEESEVTHWMPLPDPPQQ